MSSFFELYRFLIALSVINLIGFSVLFINQIKYMYAQQDSNLTALSFGVFPKFMFYSAFPKELDFNFSMSYFGFIMLGSLSCFFRWITFDREAKRIQIFNENKYAISSRLFNPWHWHNSNHELLQDYCNAVL